MVMGLFGDNNDDALSSLKKHLQHSSTTFLTWTDTWTTSQTVVLGIGCTTSLALGLYLGKLQPPWRRITSVHTVSPKMLGPDSPWLRGRVVSVSDGDTIRFWHTPTWIHGTTPTGNLSDVCLPIRICTIDTPETAKFGKPGQPFGEDAKKYLSDMILDSTVQIQLLQKDQYGRLVASVRQQQWWMGYKYMDDVMLKVGLAEVYMGSGAVYGPKGKEFYLQQQELAKQKKKGIWSQKNCESSSDFKARMKAA